MLPHPSAWLREMEPESMVSVSETWAASSCAVRRPTSAARAFCDNVTQETDGPGYILGHAPTSLLPIVSN